MCAVYLRIIIKNLDRLQGGPAEHHAPAARDVAVPVRVREPKAVSFAQHQWHGGVVHGQRLQQAREAKGSVVVGNDEPVKVLCAAGIASQNVLRLSAVTLGVRGHARGAWTYRLCVGDACCNDGNGALGNVAEILDPLHLLAPRRAQVRQARVVELSSRLHCKHHGTRVGSAEGGDGRAPVGQRHAVRGIRTTKVVVVLESNARSSLSKTRKIILRVDEEVFLDAIDANVFSKNLEQTCRHEPSRGKVWEPKRIILHIMVNNCSTIVKERAAHEYVFFGIQRVQEMQQR